MRVFLIHGMGRTRLSMWVLARRLEAAGHRPETFGYWVSLNSLDAIANHFRDRVAAVLDADARKDKRNNDKTPRPYAIIGHSLGNVITRYASPDLPPGLARFIMLAPPNSSPAIARTLHEQGIFRFLTRDAGRKLADPGFYDDLPVPAVPSLIIAGNRGPRQGWFPPWRAPNDVLLTISEVMLDGVPLVEIPAVHSFLMNRKDVFAAIRDFLEREIEP